MTTGILNTKDQKATKESIRKLLKERNAILLAHNYEPPEIQDMADICGDSLELSIKASQTSADVIVFCGVHFMAETASILCPDKTILLPALNAGCPMAEMITAQGLINQRKEMPDAVVISYVNTSAAVKAESDICCTSANVIQVINSVPLERPIFMTPDRNLAQYAKSRTGRDIRYWNGFCPIHNNLTVEQVRKVKAAHPRAPFLAHPECPPEVLKLADEIKSTSGILAYAAHSQQQEFIIGTEVGILHPLKMANPSKTFIPADTGMFCPDMKKIGLGEILRALETMNPEVRVSEEIRRRAKAAVERMLAIPSK